MESNYKKTRHEAFLQLAEKRVAKALRGIESVKKLADRKNYVYTPNEAQQIIAALKDMVDRTESAFMTEEEGIKFKFK